MAIDNSKMQPGRFLRWHKARRRVAEIVENLESGKAVYLCTSTRAVRAILARMESLAARSDA